MITDIKKYEAWFVTGSQHLYGPETLRQVAEDSKKIAQALTQSKHIPVKVVFKPVLTTPEAICELCTKASTSSNCIGLITWMHTFSPAKMWIAGLKALSKPFVHLHTQFNRDIPWDQIDMDFMNLNQSAHGGREFGFICTRMRRSRKVVVGHWQHNSRCFLIFPNALLGIRGDIAQMSVGDGIFDLRYLAVRFGFSQFSLDLQHFLEGLFRFNRLGFALIGNSDSLQNCGKMPQMLGVAGIAFDDPSSN